MTPAKFTCITDQDISTAVLQHAKILFSLIAKVEKGRFFFSVYQAGEI
jgi:hypothetical protein